MQTILKLYVALIILTPLLIYYYGCSQTSVSFSTKHQEDGNKSEKILNQEESCKKTTPFETIWYNDLPPLYIITPTYKRREQLAELTRLAHTLLLVPNVYWLVIEDAPKRTSLVTELLEGVGIRYEHLLAPMPTKYKTRKGFKPKGVSNRNRGLKWIRNNATEGVLYFADDDNTYDLEIFCQMRFTKRVSMWPVGLITKLGVSSPIVKNGVFQGFYDGWMAGRKFAVDMAGFAVSVKFLLERPNAAMPYVPGFEEDGFLRSLEPFEPQEIELLASNCSKILVWHTQTKNNPPVPAFDANKYEDTNIATLNKIIM